MPSKLAKLLCISKPIERQQAVSTLQDCVLDQPKAYYVSVAYDSQLTLRAW